MTITITVFDNSNKDDINWEQGKYLVSGINDVLWSDDINDVIGYIKNDLERLKNE